MNKLKVVTVIGTRPEIVRLSRVMAALDRYMTQVIVHTGQNYDYELNQVFFVSFLNSITPYMKMILPPLEKGDRGGFFR